MNSNQQKKKRTQIIYLKTFATAYDSYKLTLYQFHYYIITEVFNTKLN